MRAPRRNERPAASAPLALPDGAAAARVSEGDRLAAPFFRELQQAIRRLMSEGDRGQQRLGRQLWLHLDFNRRRLASLLQGLDGADRFVLLALPYLLHVQSSRLPGHEEAPVPVHGVANFELNGSIQLAIESLFGADLPHPRMLRHRPPLRAVFVSSAVGTIGQTDRIGLTAHIVFDQRLLGETTLAALRARLDSMQGWAKRRGVELRFELVDPAWSRAGDFGEWRNEPARAALALDEFYRAGIYLAGEVPVWWCTPAGATASAHAQIARAVARLDFDVALAFFDLGAALPPPERTRHRAAISRLNHGGLAPLAFTLELTRFALGLDQPPEPMSDRQKRRLYADGPTGPTTDPCLETADAINEALARLGDHAGRNLMLRLLYLKIGLQLTRTTTYAETFADRIARLGGFIARWGWDRGLLDLLDGLVGWPFETIDAIDRELRGFLLERYRQITDAARIRPAAFDQDEIAALGRRLVACLGYEAGRVRPQFTYLVQEPRAEDHLVVLERPDAPRRQRWAVHRHVVRHEDSEGEDPMWVGETLPAAAAWTIVNGLFRPGTLVRLVGSTARGTTAELRELFERLSALLDNPDPVLRAPADFFAPRRLRRAALLVSFDGPADAPDQAEQGAHFLPENWDILNYGRDRTNRLREMSVVTVDTWDTVTCRRFRGKGALAGALRAIYGAMETEHPLEVAPEILAAGGTAARATRSRLHQLLRTADRVVLGTLRPGERRAFVYEAGGRFQIIRRDAEGVRIVGARSPRGVVRLLGGGGDDRQHILIDPLSPSLGDIRALLDRLRTDEALEIAVGWRLDAEGAYVVICDDARRLYLRQVSPAGLEPLLLRLVRRLIHRLRTRVRDTRTLRRVLRVFEMREGRSLGSDTQLREDTVRVISRLAEPRPRHPEIWLRGALRGGEVDLYLEFEGDRYAPQTHGRHFARALVARLLAERARFARFELFIEASSVSFGAPGSRERGTVRHLRLIDLYERMLAQALRNALTATALAARETEDPARREAP